MMAGKAERKKANVQYRKLADPVGGFGGKSLQAALQECLSASVHGNPIGETVEARLFEGEPAYGSIVLNFFEAKQEFFFGELVRFEPGADLPLLKTGGGAKAYNLAQAKAPAGHEPLRGTLYFIAVGDHVVLLESDLSSARAEGYLAWLLSQVGGVIEAKAQVILDAELSAENDGGGLNDVELVTIKPQPFERSPQEQATSTGTEGATAQRSRGVAEANTLEVLRAAGMDDADLQSIVEDETSIEVTLQIKFKDKRRRASLERVDAKRLLRNVPDEYMVLSGKGGRQKNGRIVKLAYPANIELVGSLYDQKDVLRALHEGYKYFVSNGYVG